MTTRSQYVAYVQRFYDDLTQETVNGGWAIQFDDDFIGAGHTAGIPAAGSPAAGYPWVKKIVGAAPPTVALVSNSVGGTIACTLAATSEAEEASLYWNDSLAIDVTKIGMAEWRSAFSVLPSASGVQAAGGLGSAWVGGPQNLARYLMFGVSGAGGALKVWSLDGVQGAVNLAAAPIGGSAITTDTNMHTYRIDWSNNADVAFYYDGNRVNAVGSVTWTATAGANSIMQPWGTVYKPSGTGLATLTIDRIDVFNNR
jgi:hypothetical protein